MNRGRVGTASDSHPSHTTTDSSPLIGYPDSTEPSCVVTFSSLDSAVRYQLSLPWYASSKLEASPDSTIFRVSVYYWLRNKGIITIGVSAACGISIGIILLYFYYRS